MSLPTASHSEPAEEWIGTSAAAQRGGTTERQIRYWIDAERIQARKVRRGKRDVWEVLAEDVDKLASEQGQGGAEDLGAVTALVSVEATRAAVAALQAFKEHTDRAIDRETEERRSAVSELRAEVNATRDKSDELRRTAESELATLRRSAEIAEKALGDLRALVEAQAAEIAGLREELQDARRPWWARILGRERHA